MQLASTLRELSGGATDRQFKAACSRRLSSSFIEESLHELEVALPIVGCVHKQENAAGRQRLFDAGLPTAAAEAHLEALALSALQYCRRIRRLSAAMLSRTYTPSGVQLLVHDLKVVCAMLDELLLPATANK
jgi:hypothetical protein